MMKGNLFGGCLAALLLTTGLAATDAQAQANLSITKTLTTPAIPPEVGINPGENIVYSISVQNLGPNSATSVVVTDSTPVGLTFVSNTGDCATAFPCNLGTMTNAQIKTITSTYTVPAAYAPPNPVFNKAEVSSGVSDPTPGNNSSIAISPVNGINCGNFAVSGGTAHTCAIVAGNGKPAPNTLEDDLIECFGDNFSDQSAPVGSGKYNQISAGAFHTCGLKTTGAIQCWGDDSKGQITETPAGTDFVQVDAGFNHTCAVRTDHSIVCWGDDAFGQATAPVGLFVQVAAGNVHSCGLHTNGTIECWGFNGDDDMSGDPIVTGVPTGDNFAQVVAGGEHVCARRQDGTVTCWGSDFGGGETNDPAGTFLSITAGDEHNCGLRAGNLAECWGDNSVGQTNEPGDAFTSIDSGAYHTCGLISDGSLLCWGDNSGFQSSPPGRSELCPICGDNVLEGRETCEACQGLGAPPCSPLSTFAACCSPVTCTAYRLSENHVCRPGTNSCDSPEVCDGINFSTCPPPGPLRPSTFVCRAALGSCDPVELCTGTSDVCPPNQPFYPSTTPCRVLAGSCDVVEKCTGTSADCPADVVIPAATACRTVAGVCDVQESCDGSSAACPEDLFKSAVTACRSSSGVCDIAETCSGTDASCPADTLAGANITCRPPAAVCDAQEQCTGTSVACPADLLSPSFTPCRAVTGGCDEVERCTGTSTTCPADSIAMPGKVCRSAATVCDTAEICAGTTKSCPADAFGPSTITCRTAVDGCDVLEKCTGASATCPADSFATTSVTCNDGAFCNGADHCNGTGGCTLHAGDPCPGPDNDNNCSESCNEASDNCSTNDPNGSSCADTDACTNGETCTNGTCSGGVTTPCDDGDVCTFDTCDIDEGCVHLPQPQPTGCLEAPKAQLFVRNSADPTKIQMKWAWKTGPSFAATLLGDPTVDTGYALCLYDRTAGEYSLAGSFRVPANALFWKLKNGRVTYSNKEGFPPGGIYQMKVKASDTAGKSTASMKGAGQLLNLPDPVASNLYFFHEPSMVAQLRTEAGMCLETEFLPGDFKKNWDNTVKAAYSR